MTDIHDLMDTHDGTALAERVRQRDVHPTELLETMIERLERVEPQINAVAERLYDQAREVARQPVDLNAPFAGVPTLIKDMFTPMAGARMSNGSLAMGEARPDFDCELIIRLRAAGCVIAGTSTSPEFGPSYTTESRRFGATRNPWNTELSAGGSSGGAAALVAARVVPLAHGNDGGGSIRVPASCCGIFGLKPSRGRMPSGPMTGEGWAGMGTPHALTLSVRDSARLLDATAGADLGAPYAAPWQAETFLSATSQDPKPLRIALIESLDPWQCEPQALAAVRHTAQLCEQLGHHVEQAVLPVNLPQFLEHAFDIIGPNTQAYLNLVQNMSGQPIDEQLLEVRTRILLRERGNIPAWRYTAAIEGIHALGRRLAGFLTEYDLILTPTLAHEPPPVGTLDACDDDFELATLIERNHRYSPFTALFNASGQPAMSVPLYWTPAGLPLGSHFAARFGEESTLLVLAAQLERAQPWAGRVPPVNSMKK